MGMSEYLPIEGHPDLADIDTAIAIKWYKTADALAEATQSTTGFVCGAIDNDFWANHVALLEQLEELQPGIAEKVFKEFEQVVQRRRNIER